MEHIDAFLDKFTWFYYNEQFNILISTKNSCKDDAELFFPGQPVWIVAEHVTFKDILDELDLLEYLPIVNPDIGDGYTETLLEFGGTHSIKFCVLKATYTGVEFHQNTHTMC